MNLKLDIEDKLWRYFESERAFNLLYQIYSAFSAKDKALVALSSCEEKIEQSDPISKLCLEIAAKHNVNVEIKIFEGDIGRAEKVIGCIAGNDFLYFHYLPRIQEQLDLSEISHIVEHEFGHYFFRTKVSPEELCSSKILNSLGLPNEEAVRIQTLAFMLAHISEFNADRFAVFSSKNIPGFYQALKKLYEKELQRWPDPAEMDKIIKYREINWHLKYLLAHPIPEDRFEALVGLEKYLYDPDFDINQTPEVYNKILELLNYNEFMQEYGEYYDNPKVNKL